MIPQINIFFNSRHFMKTFTQGLVSSGRRGFSSHLKEKMGDIISKRQKEVIAFRKEHSETVIGNVSVGAVMGGMRGLPGLLYETSKLDPAEGIAYRGHSLRDIQAKGAKTVAGGEPIPEGVLWLLLTGEFPSESEIKDFKEEMYKRGALSAE